METEEDMREEMEIEKLKSEVHEMARRIVDYRKTVPDLVTKVLRSNLAAWRPIDPTTLEVATSTGNVIFDFSLYCFLLYAKLMVKCSFSIKMLQVCTTCPVVKCNGLNA